VNRIVAALSGLLLLAGCGGGASDDADTLHVGSQRGGTKALMLASGVLDGAPYKIEWSEFPAAQHLLEAIGGGAVDVGLTGDAPFIFAYQSGSRIKAVGAQRTNERPRGRLSLIVPRNSNVRKLFDLKGKTIATTRGSVGHYLIIRGLQSEQLPPHWVKLAFLTPGDAKAAFDSGSIDAWATWVPFLSTALEGGAKIIVDEQDVMNPLAFDVANENAIKGKAALLRDFLEREAKALRWAEKHIEEYTRILSKETGLPTKVARDYVIKQMRRAVPIDDAVIEEQRQVLTDFQKAGAVAGTRDLSAGFEKSFSKTEVAAAQ